MRGSRFTTCSLPWTKFHHTLGFNIGAGGRAEIRYSWKGQRGGTGPSSGTSTYPESWHVVIRGSIVLGRGHLVRLDRFSVWVFYSLLTHPLVLETVAIVSSRQTLPFTFFTHELVFFTLMLTLFTPPLYDSSFATLYTCSCTPSSTVVAMSPFSDYPSRRRGITSQDVPTNETTFFVSDDLPF